jgi:hypothetical protein
MFSATEPLASSPIAAEGGGPKPVSGAGSVRHAVQTVAGTGARRKRQTGVGSVFNAAQLVSGASQAIRYITASGTVVQAAQIVNGSAFYTRVLSGSGDLFQPAQLVSGTSVVSYLQQGAGTVLQAAQLLQGFGTVTKTANGSGSLLSPAQLINGAGTRIRFLFGEGAVTSAPQAVYGSELFPIVIRTPSAPQNIYEVSLKDTSEPYSTTNKYLTIYQIPSYLELQPNGTFVERTVTGIITAFSATTASGTPQSISLIIVRADTIITFPVIPSLGVTNGVENIIPLRDFNLVTNDVIQVKSLGSGDVTVSLSMLLNTQPYYEVF